MPQLIPPEDFVSRSATLEDAAAATELENICSIAEVGHPARDLSETLNDWQSPYCNPTTNVRLVFDDDNLVGLAGVWIEPPCVIDYGWVCVDPAYKNRGIGTYLARWLRTTVTGLALPRAPEGARVVLHQSKHDADAEGQALLVAQGYREVRRTFRMVIDLDGPPPRPVLPEGLRIRTFDRSRDLEAVVRAEHDIFRDHWGHVELDFDQDLESWKHWLDRNEHHDPTLWFLITEGTQAIAVCLCESFVAGEPEMGYVGSLGVRRAWRRQGIGLVMLRHAFGEFYRRGKRQVSLHVDAESLTGATRLYEKAGMHVQRVNVTYELVLREGKDLSTQTLDT